jgi:metal-dependent HD superfamily phosphatase/phosphodiesterase
LVPYKKKSRDISTMCSMSTEKMNIQNGFAVR